LPASFELRVDANGAFSLRDAPSRIEALARAGASSIEEPCRGPALVALGRQAIPWLADESLTDPSLAPRLMDAPGCGGLVLKPALLGGALRCLELARQAALRGMRVAYSHLFDGPIALRMIAELATLSPIGPLASATGWHEGLDAWPKVDLETDGEEDPRDARWPWRWYRSSPEDFGFGSRDEGST
jgi:L-alanine-DL-glutamate epimerase-like enolase superfamily enzyme